VLSSVIRNTIALTLAVLLFSGCVSSPRFSSGPLSHSAGKSDISGAWKMYNDRQYHQVIPRLQQIVEGSNEVSTANEARYILGLSYEKIEGHKDAIIMFSTYVRIEPEGQYAPESRESIQRLTRNYEQQFPSEESLETNIASLRTELTASPNSMPLQAGLADLIWKQGNYDEAGRLYFDLSRKYPDFKNNSMFTERIELQTGSSSYVVLSPAELQRRDIAKTPLRIINTTSFRTGRDRYTRTAKFYVVTGQVLNRSDQTLYGVEVTTTVYGFGSTVFDTATFRIGLLNPGETRAFSSRMSNFEDMNTITRFESTATYQK